MPTLNNPLESFNIQLVTLLGLVFLTFGFLTFISSLIGTDQMESEWRELVQCFKEYLNKSLKINAKYFTSCMPNSSKSMDCILTLLKFMIE